MLANAKEIKALVGTLQCKYRIIILALAPKQYLQTQVLQEWLSVPRILKEVVQLGAIYSQPPAGGTRRQ